MLLILKVLLDAIKAKVFNDNFWDCLAFTFDDLQTWRLTVVRRSGRFGAQNGNSSSAALVSPLGLVSLQTPSL